VPVPGLALTPVALTAVQCLPAPAIEDLLAGHDDVLALPIASGTGGEGAPTPGPGTAEVLQALGIDLERLATAERLRGKPGEVTRVPIPPGERRVLLVGTGEGGPADLRRAGAALGGACRGRSLLVTTVLQGLAADQSAAAVEGLLLGGWSPPAAGTKNRNDSAPVPQALFIGADAVAVEHGRVLAAATARARDLAVTPSNVKDPAWMLERAREVAAAEGLDIDVWDTARLAADGFGALLAVGNASASPPYLVRLDHRGSGEAGAQPPVVLVGKGITFDTGGLSIKPREAMVPMKTDMSGAAAVLVAMEACARLGVSRRVVGLLPLAENALGGAAYRPGDVVRQYGGRTTEVTNTDAEGRMVLADALAYAATLDPEMIVDVATLTGAATVGLGRRHAALFATDEPLASSLEAAAERSGERVWRMPIVEDYRATLESQVADVRHIAADGRVGGGAIVAALFLREFTAGVPWAHLDIAGPARSDGAEHEVPKGATGFGARLLLRWLEGLGEPADPARGTADG